MEDISFQEIDRIYNCILLLKRYEQDRMDYSLLLQFCTILEGSIKNRITSYVNSWWRNKYKLIVVDPIEVNKSQK